MKLVVVLYLRSSELKP